MRFAVSRPVTHAVRVLLCKALNGFGGATVRVTFAQNRVHSGTLDAVIAGADLFFRVGGWRFGIVGQGVALAL